MYLLRKTKKILVVDRGVSLECAASVVVMEASVVVGNLEEFVAPVVMVDLVVRYPVQSFKNKFNEF